MDLAGSWTHPFSGRHIQTYHIYVIRNRNGMTLYLIAVSAFSIRFFDSRLYGPAGNKAWYKKWWFAWPESPLHVMDEFMTQNVCYKLGHVQGSKEMLASKEAFHRTRWECKSEIVARIFLVLGDAKNRMLSRVRQNPPAIRTAMPWATSAY